MREYTTSYRKPGDKNTDIKCSEREDGKMRIIIDSRGKDGEDVKPARGLMHRKDMQDIGIICPYPPEGEMITYP